MSLLGTLTKLQPELSSVMLSSPGLGPALEFSLLHTPENLVRKEVSTGVLRMAISLRKKSKVCTTEAMPIAWTHATRICFTHSAVWVVEVTDWLVSWVAKETDERGTGALVFHGVCASATQRNLAVRAP